MQLQRLQRLARHGYISLIGPIISANHMHGLSTPSAFGMEATGVYPNSAPVLAADGRGVSLAGNDPDHIPLEPSLINDPRRRFSPDGSAVDASGVMRLHVRNALGYAFLRPHQRNKLRLLFAGLRTEKQRDWSAQASFYRNNYRHFVPHDLLMDFLEHECPPHEDGRNMSKLQGNAVAGVDCGRDGHIVFYPTGHVLQQACAWYSQGESEDDLSCSSTVIETGSTIRQFAVMGSRDAYHSTSSAKIFAAARGTTSCTIVAAPARVTPENVRKMQAKAKISFPGVVNHVAGSPHAEAEAAFVTDGVVSCWDPEGGVRTVNKGSINFADRFLRCEYSSHPRVLWAASQVTVSTLDLRQSSEHSDTLFDVAAAKGYITIYDVKRRSRNPFQIVVGTSASIELLDTRMAKLPLISWIQPHGYSGESEFSFGAIDEVDLSRNANDERGYIVSSSKRQKITTLFPFERNRKRKRGKVMSLATLRCNGDDEYSETPRTSTEQLVAADATLDLHMEDGGEYTTLMGICALRDEDSVSGSIYQLNNVGDLYSHRVSFVRSQTKSYRTAVQPALPCGVTGQDDPTDELLSRTLPIPMDAILPEHDTESMQMFTTLPVKVLRRQFPRLPVDNNDESEEGEAKAPSTTDNHAVENHNSKNGKAESMASKPRSRSFDEDDLIEKLLNVCDPSASLFRLHRHVLDKLKIEISSSELLGLIQSTSEFRIRTVHHALPADTFRVRNPSLPGADDVHCNKDDPRLAVCTCRLGSSSSQLPCESWSCIVPHAVIVTSTSTELHLDDTAPSSAVTQEIPGDFANIITAARAVYDDLYESDPE